MTTDTKLCTICNNTTLATYKTKEGIICNFCYKKYLSTLFPSRPLFVLKALKNLTNDDIYDLLTPARKEFELLGYEPNGWYGSFLMDDQKRVIFIPSNDLQIVLNKTLFSFEEIFKVEIIEDNQSISTGSLGATIIGDAFAGSAGAIVGSNIGKKKTRGTCAKLSIKIYLDNPSTQFIEVFYVNSQKKPIKKESEQYIRAYDQISLLEAKLQYILRQNNKTIES